MEQYQEFAFYLQVKLKLLHYLNIEIYIVDIG